MATMWHQKGAKTTTLLKVFYSESACLISRQFSRNAPLVFPTKTIQAILISSEQNATMTSLETW